VTGPSPSARVQQPCPVEPAGPTRSRPAGREAPSAPSADGVCLRRRGGEGLSRRQLDSPIPSQTAPSESGEIRIRMGDRVGRSTRTQVRGQRTRIEPRRFMGRQGRRYRWMDRSGSRTSTTTRRQPGGLRSIRVTAAWSDRRRLQASSRSVSVPDQCAIPTPARPGPRQRRAAGRGPGPGSDRSGPMEGWA
jgi:hypothetical protein